MKKALLLLALLLVLFGCGREQDGVKLMLEQVNSMMNDQPDLALKLLQQQDVSSFHSPEHEARYRVLMTRALDKTYHTFTHDSIIAPAMGYYLYHGSDADRAEAFFYMSRVHRYINSTPDVVMQWLVKAERYVVNTDNEYLKALILCDRAIMLERQMNNKEAAAEYEKAKDICNKLGLKRSTMMCSEGLAYQHFIWGNNSLALDNYTEALSLAKELGDTSKILLYSNHIIKMKHEDDRNSKVALERLHCLYRKYNRGEVPDFCYGLLSTLHLDLKQYDSARYYANRYLEHNGTGTFAYYLLSMVEETSGDYKKALEYNRLQATITDSLHALEKKNIVQELEQRYRNKELQNEIDEMAGTTHLSRAISILASLALVLVLALSYIIYRRVVAQHKQRIAQVQEVNNSLLQHQNDLQQVNTQLCERLNSQEEHTIRLSNALQRKFNNIKAITAKASGMESSEVEFMREFHKFMSVDAKETEQTFSDLIDVVNLNFNGFATVLSQRHPNLSEDDIRFCCLICLGYSTNNIRFIYGLKHPNSVYVKRANIRNRLNLTGDKDSIEVYIADMLRELGVQNILVEVSED